MPYPTTAQWKKLTEQLELYTQLKTEYSAAGMRPILENIDRVLAASLKKLKGLPPDRALSCKEPNSLATIRKLRPAGPRRIWKKFDTLTYRRKIEGALLGRMAGCTLGSAVEFWPIDQMERLAKESGEAFPPVDYWRRIPDLNGLRYQHSPRWAYTRDKMNGVPVDDDIVYTLIGLLILEAYGPDFTVDDVGTAWVKYLPHACTAEDSALKNLKKGVPANRTADKENPYCEWIGADIRSDPWGYAAPGWPEKAAELAYRDAYLSHRRNGIYGEMFFAAAISAAFVANHPLEAVRIGLTEIPQDCATAQGVRWALSRAPRIKNYQQARDAVDTHFKGMHRAHTINNACLTVWGLAIGGLDFTKVISQTVAMGMDNDCTAATAGSIVGAIVGKKGIAPHWYKRFNNTVHSYLIGKPKFRIDDLLRRFAKQAVLNYR
jgi:ADP-ribosylglycohydrolase